jgi:hypothetical protein
VLRQARKKVDKGCGDRQSSRYSGGQFEPSLFLMPTCKLGEASVANRFEGSKTGRAIPNVPPSRIVTRDFFLTESFYNVRS